MKRVTSGSKLLTTLLKFITCILSILLTAMVLVLVVFNGDAASAVQNTAPELEVMSRFDRFVTNTLSEALDGVLSIKKVYWLSDSDLVAPEPNQDCYGEASDPAEVQWLLDEAQTLLEGQQTLFSTDVELKRNSKINYYLDETIFAITWQQVIDHSVYTISEIKIADPSQFRRFLAGGEFGSSQQFVTSEMAASVNAVVASSGDFYKFRNTGIVVYDSQMMRMEGQLMDTCLIDAAGDLRFVYAREITDQAEAQKFVEENGIRFSLAFGPALVDGGEIYTPTKSYPVGEVAKDRARIALCQLDTLHYALIAVSAEPGYGPGHTLYKFAEVLRDLGVDKAYNLDGGQTATLVMNDKLMNYVYERQISDIIYFATALPEGE